MGGKCKLNSRTGNILNLALMHACIFSIRILLWESWGSNSKNIINMLRDAIRMSFPPFSQTKCQQVSYLPTDPRNDFVSFIDHVLTSPKATPHFIKGSTKGKIWRITSLVFLISPSVKTEYATVRSRRLIWYPYYHIFGILYDHHKCHKMTIYGIYDGHKMSYDGIKVWQYGYRIKCLALTVADKYKIFSFHWRGNEKNEITYSRDFLARM